MDIFQKNPDLEQLIKLKVGKIVFSFRPDNSIQSESGNRWYEISYDAGKLEISTDLSALNKLADYEEQILALMEKMKNAETVYSIALQPEHYLLLDSPYVTVTEGPQVKIDSSKDIQTTSEKEDDRIVVALEECKETPGKIIVKMESFEQLSNMPPESTKTEPEIVEPAFDRIQVILKDESTFTQELIGVELKPVSQSSIGIQAPGIPYTIDDDSDEISQALKEAKGDISKLEQELKKLTGFEVPINVDWIFRKSFQFKKETLYSQRSCFRSIVNKIIQIVQV